LAPLLAFSLREQVEPAGLGELVEPEAQAGEAAQVVVGELEQDQRPKG